MVSRECYMYIVSGVKKAGHYKVDGRKIIQFALLAVSTDYNSGFSLNSKVVSRRVLHQG